MPLVEALNPENFRDAIITAYKDKTSVKTVAQRFAVSSRRLRQALFDLDIINDV